jgi:hypothetical protein
MVLVVLILTCRYVSNIYIELLTIIMIDLFNLPAQSLLIYLYLYL